MKTKQYDMKSPKALFLSTITKKGPEVIDLEPSLNLNQEELKDLAFKSIPMNSKDGDFISCSFPNYQAACLINQVPSFDEIKDARDTFVSFGMILDKNANPIPYRNILLKIAEICRENKVLTIEVLRRIMGQLLKSITIRNECSITLEIKKGTKVEFEFLDAFTQKNNEPHHKKEEEKMTDKLYQGILTQEEALEREKNAFILDKTILKAICSEGPIALDDLRRKTLPLEKVLGIKIDVSTIEEIIQRYIKEGIIKSVPKE